ncbi:unnamed protein product [Calicophoron daubneyi]|uniref:Acyltransferase n=1 Tax=Calicophoron daubneyi TaxID=300641 RepID=A0AAV2TNW3_CALDB
MKRPQGHDRGDPREVTASQECDDNYGRRRKDSLSVAMAITAMIFFSILLCYLIISQIFALLRCLHIFYTRIITGQSVVGQSDLMIFKSVPFDLLCVYLLFMIWDWGAEDQGSHPRRFLLQSRVWNWLADYFSTQMVLTDELKEYSRKYMVPNDLAKTNDAEFKGLPWDRNYIVGVHPHGIFSSGCFFNFMTDAGNFRKLFPNLRPFIAALKIHFKIPFYRDIIMAIGGVGSSRIGLRYLLDSEKCKKKGNFVIVVVGGPQELLEARPGRYVTHVSKRFGFFRLALQTGSPMIPCITFGETNMYHQVQNKPGSYLRRFQDLFLKLTTVPLPLFYGYGPIPYPSKLTTVVGAPIECERVENPTNEQVAAVKEKYLQKLKELFERYKNKYDPNADDLQIL